MLFGVTASLACLFGSASPGMVLAAGRLLTGDSDALEEESSSPFVNSAGRESSALIILRGFRLPGLGALVVMEGAGCAITRDSATAHASVTATSARMANGQIVYIMQTSQQMCSHRSMEEGG